MATPSEPSSSVDKFQRDVLKEMLEVEGLLKRGNLHQVKKLSRRWKGLRANDPMFVHIARSLHVWIDHHLQFAEQPEEAVDERCPYQIMERMLSALIDIAHGFRALLLCDEMLQLFNASSLSLICRGGRSSSFHG
eukprot:COSAG06_NODE_2655_length_6487_cov_123.824515_5_plen_135_part_00